MRWLLFAILSLLFPVAPVAAQPVAVRKTENLLIVTLDGFRWQEFFRGADETLIDKKAGGVSDPESLRKEFWRETAEARRQTLLPFIWGEVARQGQIFGDPSKNAAARLTNGLKFSYPGYSELFCGLVDDRVDANARKNNPNQSVLEFLNERPSFKDRVAAYCTWDIFPYIFRSSQNRLKVISGWNPALQPPLTEKQRYLQQIMAKTPHYWGDNVFDVFTMELAEEELMQRKPRVLYIGLGETDEWGHGRRYDLYLRSAQNADRFVAQLWQKLQSIPQYAGKTSLIITCDHGRGNTRIDWTDHGKDVPLAEYIWVAVLGPDVPALGVRENQPIRQTQLAATIAQLLGEDFTRTNPKIAPSLPIGEEILRQGNR
jgi:hypothetical protein